MSIEFCRTCGEMIFAPAIGAPHRCPPAWQVWCPDRGASPWDGRRVCAPTAAEAAERWARDDDIRSADWSIVAGETPVVYVLAMTTFEAMTDSDDPEILAERYRVSGEQVAQYHATEVTK